MKIFKTVAFVGFYILFDSTFAYAQRSGIKKLNYKPMVILDGKITFTKQTTFDQEVTILPQAWISTMPGINVQFNNRVNVLGESQVFDKAANLHFATGTISELNVAWFGAKGYDNADDTEIFRKVLSIAKMYPNSINIIIPTGRYFISSTLEVKGDLVSKKSINWVGSSISNSSIQGASLSWTGSPGGIMIRFTDISQSTIRNMDFTAEPNSLVKHNLSFKPFIHAIWIEHCSFTGCGGPGSSNIDINAGNGDQVSEIHISSSSFHGVHDGASALSQSAIKGGLANAKNFYIQYCAFNAYHTAAVDIETTDILQVSESTFSNNDLDISCALCGTYAINNYSEHSKAFFKASVSANVSFTTLINNNFTGDPTDGFIIRDGAGSLILLNNNFGGTDQRADLNRIKWEESGFNPIYSVGNFFKNSDSESTLFINRSNQPKTTNIISIGDVGGLIPFEKKKISNDQ